MALDKTLLKKLSILYVEDDNTIRTELASLLTNFFNQVFTANDGDEGLNIYKNKQKKIDLIISDITMPKMSGIEMVKKIREFDKDIAVIYATAYSDKEFLIDSIKLKVFNYIIKPIDIRALLESSSELAEILHTKEIIHNKNRELSKYKEAIDANSIVIKTDTHMKIIYVNSHFCKITGYDNDELIGKDFLTLAHSDVDKSIYNNMYANVLDNKMWNGKLKQSTKEGSTFIVDSYMITTHDEDGNINGSIIIQRDITEDTIKQRKVQMALMKEKSDIFIKSKEGFAKKSIKINKLENDIKELEQVIKNSETQRDKYLYLVGKYKTDIKRLKIRVSNFEKEELGKVTGINVLRIQKENADLRIEVKRLKDRLENLLDDMHKKINQTKVTYDIQVEDLEKELNECKEKLKSVGNEQVLSQKVTYWKEKAKTESQKVDELEQKIMRYADKSVLTKVFASK